MTEMQPVSDRIPISERHQSAHKSRQHDPGFPDISVASLTYVRNGLLPLQHTRFCRDGKAMPPRSFNLCMIEH